MAGKILDNGALVTLGLVAAVAAIGAANKAGLYGSRAHISTASTKSGDILDDLGRIDRIKVIGSIKHPPKGMSEDATYIVILRRPDDRGMGSWWKGWSVVLLDDKGRRYSVEYANVPSEAMALAMAESLYGVYNHDATRKEMKKWEMYRK